MQTLTLPECDRRRSWWLFVFYLSFFTLTGAGFDSSEGSLSYRQAVLVLAEGRLTVDGEPENINYFVGPDGHRYSAREFGSALLQFPVAAANRLIEIALSGTLRGDLIGRAQQFLVALQAGLFMAATARYFFLILRERYGSSVRGAWLATLLLMTTTYCWSYSHSLFDGVVALPFLTGSFYHLLRYESGGRDRDVALSAALVGFGVVIRVSVLFAVVGLFAGLAFSAFRRRRLALRPVLIAVGVLAPFGVWMLWYNALRTGSSLVSPMQLYESQNGLSGNLLEGLFGLVLSPGKGLLIYCPLLLLSAVLFPRFARRDPIGAGYLVVVGGLWFLVHARLQAWHGSAGWGPRHFITVVPLLMLPFGAELATVARFRALVGATIVLALAGGLLALASVVVNPHHRETVAWQEGRRGDEAFIWSVSTAQSIDAVRGACHNVGVIFGSAEPVRAVGASDLNNYASNTVNVWPNTFVRAGVSRSLVTAVCVALVGVLVYSGFRSCGCGARCTSVGGPHSVC